MVCSVHVNVPRSFYFPIYIIRFFDLRLHLTYNRSVTVINQSRNNLLALILDDYIDYLIDWYQEKIFL